jgi:hypothetical protein
MQLDLLSDWSNRLELSYFDNEFFCDDYGNKVSRLELLDHLATQRLACTLKGMKAPSLEEERYLFLTSWQPLSQPH